MFEDRRPRPIRSASPHPHRQVNIGPSSARKLLTHARPPVRGWIQGGPPGTSLAAETSIKPLGAASR